MSLSPVRCDPGSWRRLPAEQLFQQPALREAWDRLNRSRGGLPFLDAEVVKLACDTFRPIGLELLVGEVDGEAQCMMLVQRVGVARWQLYQPAQVPLGLLVAEHQLSLGAIACSALRALPCDTLVLSLTQLDPRQWPPPHEVPACVVRHYISTGWIDCRQDFDEYWSARSVNLRASVGKSRRRLEASGFTLETRVLMRPQDMAVAVSRYGALETGGWKGRMGTAVNDGTPQGQFYARWLEAAAERGEARIYELVVRRQDGIERVIASDLCVLRGESLVLLKVAYDEEFERYSPSTLLRQDFLRHVLGDSSIQRIEFFGRMMDWHRRWTGQERSLYHLTTFRWRWLARLRAAGADAR